MNEVPFTPSIVIDLAVALRNVRRMADYARSYNLALRPHAKTHKSVEMAQRQLQAGAVGLTAAKVGEAEIFQDVASDILIAYPAVDAFRASRIAQLAKRVTLRVAVDSALSADRIAEFAAQAGTTVGILVDIDVGNHRTGVQSPQDARTLAQQIDRTPSLRLDGLMCYPGHLSTTPADRQGEEMRQISQILRETIALLKEDGLEAKIISGGSTPTALQSHLAPEINEIRPGTYIYNDMNSVRAGCCALDDCAATIVCTVVSDAVPGKVVIDAGSKTLTQDRLMTDPNGGGFGYIVEYPDAKIIRLSEEHGEVDVTQCDQVPKLGERVRVIPNHICPCVNLQDSVWFRREDGSLHEHPVDARGKLA